MKNDGSIEIREYADTRSCNCCSKSNHKDKVRIFEASFYNYIGRSIAVALCEDDLYNLMVKAQEVLAFLEVLQNET